MNLWEQFELWKKDCRWIDLSRQISPDTPHWAGFPAMEIEKQYDVVKDGFDVFIYKLVGQYGTHIDAPSHFVNHAATLDSFQISDMVLPLCVIDKTEEVKKNPDYALTKEAVLEWEKEHEKIPEGAFVAFCSGWSKKETMDEMENKDAKGEKHYPGWDVGAIRFLIEERGVKAIGHETCDTDPAVIGAVNGYPGEYYILEQGKYQIELLSNLEQCPATGSIIFCVFPNVKGASGFTGRCFALCRK